MKKISLDGSWNAASFFERLANMNRLAAEHNFCFCRVSGLEGFEQAIAQIQEADNFVCVSDISDGFTEINNTPRSRSVKTVFLSMRHPPEDMAARQDCMDTMRTIFRQFMSALLPEKVRLEQNCIYIDSRIAFSEIDRYFFSGAACAFFQIAVDVFADLSFNPDHWADDFSL